MAQLSGRTARRCRRSLERRWYYLPLMSVSASVLAACVLCGCGSSSVQTDLNNRMVTGTAPPPTVDISSNPATVSPNQAATLSWSSTNATSCTASGSWSGSQATSGTSSTGALSSSSTYMLTCTGTGGSVSQSATVTVAASTPAPSPPPTGLSCANTSGPLTLKASAVRAAGISPLLMFFDATGTTDSAITGNTTAFQDVAYTWNFGDANASGTGTWKYGSNAGRNSKNSATGGVAAHLYVTPGADTAYTVTVTANDGTHTTSCQLGVTAYDPAGANGFAGTKTACVSASGTPVAGSGGCPAGASCAQAVQCGLGALFPVRQQQARALQVRRHLLGRLYHRRGLEYLVHRGLRRL